MRSPRLGHNAITEYLKRTDAAFVRLNLLLLMVVSFLPFPGLFLPILAVIGYLAIALYYIIPSRGLSADFFPAACASRRVRPEGRR